MAACEVLSGRLASSATAQSLATAVDIVPSVRRRRLTAATAPAPRGDFQSAVTDFVGRPDAHLLPANLAFIVVPNGASGPPAPGEHIVPDHRGSPITTHDATQAPLPLQGLRVIALEHAVAAPLCTRHLADLGADVIKIERPGTGDLARSYDSVVRGQSAYFVWANRGKRSVVFDLRTEEDREVLWKLIERSDVFVHNLGPGAVDRLGFDPAAVSARNPRIVNCAISGYGSGGPYVQRKAFDLLIQGEAGLLSVTGDGAEPAKVGISVADMCAAVYALSSILAALHARDSSDRGTFIDISLLDCLSEWMMAPTYHQLYGGTQLPRAGARHNMMVPYGVYPVGSGEHVNFAVQTEPQWRALCTVVLGDPELCEDERFASNESRVRNRRELELLIEQRFSSMDAAKTTSLLHEADIPFADVRDLRGLAGHPQLAARDRWFEIDSPGGPVRALRAPFNFDRTRERRSAVPALGEHTDAVRAELGLAPLESWPGHTSGETRPTDTNPTENARLSASNGIPNRREANGHADRRV